MSFSIVTNAARRFLLTLAVVLLVSSMASAYTVIMRGGRRIEIPDRFTVTRTTLTYEAVAGINVTLQMTAIDIPATERANSEPPGSLLKRAEPPATAPQTTSGLQAPRVQAKPRTVTDRDLERYRRARLESEAAYEKRRIELGLPSLEESRRRAAREEAALDEIIARRRQEEWENYRRERDVELQAEMAAINAKVNALNYRSGPYGPGGFFAIGDGAFGPVNSRFRLGFHRRFPFGFIQGSPCGFNPGISCIQAFPFGLNQEFFPRRGLIFVAPGTNVGGHSFGAPGGGRVLVSPGPRH